MSESKKAAAAEDASAAKQARLAAALRENLKRRKAQSRAQSSGVQAPIQHEQPKNSQKSKEK
jgi:hypothetical protein